MSGVRCQGGKTKNLKPGTSVFVIDDETEIYLLNGETECGNLSPAVTGDHFASTYGDMSSWDLSVPVILPYSRRNCGPPWVMLACKADTLCYSLITGVQERAEGSSNSDCASVRDLTPIPW